MQSQRLATAVARLLSPLAATKHLLPIADVQLLQLPIAAARQQLIAVAAALSSKPLLQKQQAKKQHQKLLKPVQRKLFAYC